MASKKMMMETFVRQYVMYCNTIINDEREMMVPLVCRRHSELSFRAAGI